MRFSGFLRFVKDNIHMIAVTVAAILLYLFLVPLDIQSFISEYFLPIGFVAVAVILCIFFLPAGIKMLRQAKNGEIHVGPLTPGKVVDVFPILDEDEVEMGFQYIVSFVNNKGLRSLGFTDIVHGKQTYHKGDTVNLRDIAKQAKEPGPPQDSRPTYDVDLWDDQCAADELQATRVYGWLLVGITVIWILVSLVIVCLHLPCLGH